MKKSDSLNEVNSLLCITIDQGVVGEHEASVGTQQEGVPHIRDR